MELQLLLALPDVVTCSVNSVAISVADSDAGTLDARFSLCRGQMPRTHQWPLVEEPHICSREHLFGFTKSEEPGTCMSSSAVIVSSKDLRRGLVAIV